MSIRSAAVLLVLCLAASACREHASMAATSPRSVLLDSTAARDFMQPCSRPAPTRFDGYWMPSSVAVAHADSLVTLALASHLAGRRWLPDIPDSLIPRPAHYVRQYVGVLIKGTPVLYVNGFNRVVLQDTGMARLWLHHYVGACDGSTTYFGAEVWMRGDSVREFHFDGSYATPPSN